MSNTDGWIKLYRKFKLWGWYQNSNIKSVFIHCLISANFSDGEYEGEMIPRGSFIASYGNMASELGMPKTTLYRCLKQLSESGEIEISKILNGKSTVFSVKNYADYQGFGGDSQKSRKKSRENFAKKSERKRNGSNNGNTDINSSDDFKSGTESGTQTERQRNDSGTDTIYKKDKKDKKERNITPFGENSETPIFVEEEVMEI